MSAKAALEYFREHMDLGDYLAEDGQAEMVWTGKDAERLRLQGACRQADFELMCQGEDPRTGMRLMLRDCGSQRRVCFFAQVSAPKDVSITCLVGGDRRIATWWKEAVAETVREIEAVAATRVRKGGACEDRVTGSMVAAIVTHEASRALRACGIVLVRDLMRHAHGPAGRIISFPFLLR